MFSKTSSDENLRARTRKNPISLQRSGRSAKYGKWSFIPVKTAILRILVLFFRCPRTIGADLGRECLGYQSHCHFLQTSTKLLFFMAELIGIKIPIFEYSLTQFGCDR